jgi:predicted nucleotidyltransferase
MRITPIEQEVIKRAAQECFDASAVVRLFGSRVDDSKKGGDIDLFVQTSLVDAEEISKAHTRFLAKLYAELGEQKIDVVIDYPSRTVQLPIFAIALEQGIIL